MHKVVTGVTASQALIDEAIKQNAQAIIVHHGYFWKGEAPEIRGMKRNRLKALLANDINLYGYHLPLDVHETLGNNVQLAKLLGITINGEIELGGGPSVLLHGEFESPLSVSTLSQTIADNLGRQPLAEAQPNHANQDSGVVYWRRSKLHRTCGSA